MESARLAQCAACLNLTLLRHPRPPEDNGNVAADLADPDTDSGATPIRVVRPDLLLVSLGELR